MMKGYFKIVLMSLFSIIYVFFATGCDDNSEEILAKYRGNLPIEVMDDFIFYSYDGLEISAAGAQPVVAEGDEDKRFPAVILMHGWTGSKKQLKPYAEAFASRGYIAVCYTTRGFGREDEIGSEGYVGFGDTNDINDFRACIDWIIDNTPVDEDNIGAMGYSYGAGISLKALAFDERLKAVAARNPWTDLQEQFYAGNTPRMAGTSFLHDAAVKYPGYAGSEGCAAFENFIHRVDVDETIAWLKGLSPISYVDMINSREGEPAVYIKKGFGDYLLQVNAITEFFNALNVDKRLYLNRSVHGTDASALDPVEDFDTVPQWFDYHLKGIDNGLMHDKVGIVAYDLDSKSYLETYETWPPAEAQVKTYYTGPRYLIGNGQLLDEPRSWQFRNWIETYEQNSGVSTGIPWVTMALWHHEDRSHKSYLRLTKHENVLIYESSELESDMMIRGMPRMTVWVSADAPVSELQLIAYLYDVDDDGVGTYLTHGPATIGYENPGEVVKVSFEMLGIAHDIQAGRHIAVALNTKDPLFMDPPLEDYRAYFHYFDDERQSKVEIPFVE